jgi:hypothetical protein
MGWHQANDRNEAYPTERVSLDERPLWVRLRSLDEAATAR